MILLIEAVVACLLFTLAVYAISRKPIDTLYNYPPRIQQRVRSLPQYEGQIPTSKRKLTAKLAASLIFLILLALIMRYVNGCRTFLSVFGSGMILWTAVNLYDAIVLDIIWFCHDPHFVLAGTEDMVADYHDYRFHLRGFLIGEALALVICTLAGLLVPLLP